MANKHMKIPYSTSYVITSSKLTQHWDVTMYLLKSLKFTHQQYQTEERPWDNRNSYYSLLVSIKQLQLLGKTILTDSSKSKHSLSIWSHNCIPWHLSKWVETCPHKNLHMDVYNSFIHIVKTLKQLRCLAMGE